MAAEEQTPAIVLRARDYSESDRIVTLLTRDLGKLSGIARGAKASRRRFAGKLEPFSHVMLYFRRRPHGELVFITRAEGASLAPIILDDDLGKIALGSYMVELADSLASAEAEARQAYSILADSLLTLAAAGSSPALRQAFELKILGWAGFGLEFDRCRVCATPSADSTLRFFFVIARGGVICIHCRQDAPECGLPLSADSARALTRIGVDPIETAAQAQPAGADGSVSLARYIGSIIDRRLRSVEFLDSVMPAGSGPAR
ncbi:MAG: DNA repair protein RecO [Candidatus Binataceae bacterium]|nr:DNA repair protein RecO [Candidatus Binataceae bacterium]